MNYFQSTDLAKIKRNTNNNNHTENLEFIAKKIHSKLQKDFKEINKQVEKDGYLRSDLNTKQYELYQKLMEELNKKSPQDYEEVHSRL